MSCVSRSGPIRELGGKAFALARLDAAELPIPEWFAVTPAAFARSITAEQQEALSSGQIERVHDALAGLEPAADVAAEISEAVNALAVHGGNRFAVRSSAADEDGAESSFAGQLASYLFVDAESVVRRVADVWRSGFTERIFEYRRQRGMPPTPIGAPAVLVQRMIVAEAAGVAFSADPVSGRRGLAVVSAVHGIGTSLVGGEADADVYKVNRAGTIEQQIIAHKQLRHGFDAGAEEGVSAQTVPADEMDRPALSAHKRPLLPP